MKVDGTRSKKALLVDPGSRELSSSVGLLDPLVTFKNCKYLPKAIMMKNQRSVSYPEQCVQASVEDAH
jgi:hypothetical protein